MEFLKSYTGKLIVINIIFFILFLILTPLIPNLVNYLGLQPAAILAGKNLWTILTSMFMHAGLMHLFVNMFSLFFIGIFVERLIGKKRFLIFYLLAGISASLFFVFLSGFFGFGFFEKIFGNPEIYGVGASGAIFGLLGLMAVLTPKNKIYLIAGPIIAIVLQILLDSIYPALSSAVGILITIYIFLSIFLIFSPNPRMRKIALPLQLPLWLAPVIAIVPLVILGLFVSLPIGNTAHLGGLIAGLIYGFYLRRKYPRKTEMISRMFSR